jgi:integrase
MIRKRGDKYTVQVYDARSGKKVWVGTFDKRGDAKEAETGALQELKRTRIRGSVTCDGFAETWVERFPRPKESTNRHNAERIRQFAEDFKGVRLSDITRADARDWALKHRSNVPAVRAMLNDAMRDDLLEANPFEDMRLPQSRGRRDLVVPTEEQVARLVQVARDTHGEYGRRVYANMLQFSAYSGLRIGELFGLRWSDVDRVGRTVRVERQWHVKGQVFTSTKSGKPRAVFLTDEALEALEATARDYELAEIFLTPNGKRFSGGSVTYWWNPVRAAAGLPGFPMHGLRHFFGTYLARMGVGPIQIAAMMGHQDGGRLAMELYVHMSEQDALASVARALGGSGPQNTLGSMAGLEQRRRRSA